MDLMMIRHAESVGNREYRIQGRVDYALSEQGIEQAHALGQFLVNQCWKPTHIYVSPLQRTIHTAEILRDYWATRGEVVALAHCLELQEVNNGILEGLTWAEAQMKHPSLCKALMGAADWIPIPEAESWTEVRVRAQSLTHRLIAQHQNSDRIWLVSHGGFLQYAVSTLLGSDRTWGLSIPPTAIFEFEIDLERWDDSGQMRHNALLWRIQRFNDVGHLGSAP
jgi:broad specificity phosphatase PhoE